MTEAKAGLTRGSIAPRKIRVIDLPGRAAWRRPGNDGRDRAAGLAPRGPNTNGSNDSPIAVILRRPAKPALEG
jgi:hypothetical protein